MQKPGIGRFHLLTDFHFQQRHAHAELARLGAEGGADTIQFRQKAGGLRGFLYEAERTAAACQRAGVPLLVNDRADVALAVGAAGIHLGQTDMPVRLARRILGEAAVIGATATTVDDAFRAQDEGADYVGFGPVYPTASKSNPASVKGVAGLERACRAVSIPVIAIAGITPERVWPVLDAGAHGFAVMTAVTTATSPSAAAARFKAELEAWLSGR